MSEENFDVVMVEAESDLELEDEVLQSSEKSHELDEDSDYCGSEHEIEQTTTLRMLFEKIQGNDLDFIESCQQAHVISRNASCDKCFTPMALAQIEDSLDGIEWLCSTCPTQRSVRDRSWFEDIGQLRLKEIIPILYCWSRNYPDHLCQHEIELVGICRVTLLYNKCSKLIPDYFNHEISSIGVEGEVVEIEEFHDPFGQQVIAGVERNNMKKVFFKVLPKDWTRDDLATAIADNLVRGTILSFQNLSLLKVLGETGLDYLKNVWGLGLETTYDLDNAIGISLCDLYKKLFNDDSYSEKMLMEFLFRRRMESSRDSFLFLLSVIAQLHPPF